MAKNPIRAPRCFGFSATSWSVRPEATTHAVGQKVPNDFGVHDMLGNVFEWCEDAWHGDYNGAPTDGSAWERGASESRVLRGGSFDLNPRALQAAYRYANHPGIRYGFIGFRVVWRVAGGQEN